MFCHRNPSSNMILRFRGLGEFPKQQQIGGRSWAVLPYMSICIIAKLWFTSGWLSVWPTAIVDALGWAVAPVRLAPVVRRPRLILPTTSPLPLPLPRYYCLVAAGATTDQVAFCLDLLPVPLFPPFTFLFLHFVDAKDNYRLLMAGYSVCVFQELQCAAFFVHTEFSHNSV